MQKIILVIDDEKSLRVTFGKFLTDEGYEVMLAQDYQSALEVILQHNVDVIFADIILGAHSGMEILREVKRLGQLCPVVMITGEPNMETATKSVRLGAFDYVPKPIEQKTLIRIAKHALRHKMLVDENERFRLNLEAIFKSVQDGIITIDPQMRVIETNEAIKKFFHFAPKEIIGKHFADVINESQKTCLELLEQTLKTQEVINEFTVEWTGVDGKSWVVVMNCAPLLDQNNTFMGAVLVLRDATRITDLERELQERRDFQKLIGKNRKMQKIYKLLESLADTETTILITGESGTGKELVAEALHNISSRRLKSLVKVNCSALSENLLESELFGHVKGAFTGAVKDKDGRFQVADGGTILLDEIGDISQAIQLKLLRVLQEKEFERVGDSMTVKVDVRVTAATNRDLKEKVKKGEFREDLYYRLKVVEITLPPLRERLEDIPLFLNHFLNMFNKKFKKNIRGVSDEAVKTFLLYAWPGNIRELEHALERAFILCQGQTITLEHLPSEVKEYSKNKLSTHKNSCTNDSEEVLQALNKADWNKAKAARLLGIDRSTIYKKIDKYKLTKPLD